MVSKYRNVPVESGGMRFDSKAEAAYWRDLVLLQDAGEISGLKFHPKYLLMPGYNKPDGEHVRAIWYEGDMEYVEQCKTVCADVKGVETDVFKIKAKLMGYYHPDIELRIVKA